MKDLQGFPLYTALLERRSRRFAKGMDLQGGPLTYKSTDSPKRLSIEDEAALVFAACGITGPALAELPYQAGDLPESGGGNIMVQFAGRTIPSGDALHSVVVMVLNDDGAWMIRRPQDFPHAEIPDLVRAAKEQRLVELYKRSRVQIAEVRPTTPREVPFMLPFNKWSANVEGTTYILPINDLTGVYINLLLSTFSEDLGYFLIDDRNSFRPAGVGRFARSKGGHLDDDPNHDRVVPMSILESYALESLAIEQGAIIQNLGLMTQALGLGGFPHFAAHPFVWFDALGFDMEEIPASKVLGAGPLMRLAMRLLKKDLPVPTPVGLYKDGEALLKPFCPPHYPTMEAAVLAFIDFKFKEGSGVYRDPNLPTAFADGAEVLQHAAEHSDQAIAATVACCEYLYKRYGRFPPTSGPFRSILAYQAHHLDFDFYDRFYTSEALGESQRARRAE